MKSGVEPRAGESRPAASRLEDHRRFLVRVLAVGGLAIALADPAVSQWRLPSGLTVTYQTEYSYGKSQISGASDESAPIFENWLNVDYSRSRFTAGLRFVAFKPPDPSIYPGGPDSYGVDFLYGEYLDQRVNVRGGHFYGLFGRGLAFRAYENRDLRVDTDLQGARGSLFLGDGELTVLSGLSVEGNAEDADRGRSEAITGGDLEHGLPLGFRAGGSWLTTKVPVQGGDRLEPQRMKAGRLSWDLLGVDLYGEFARVDGPETEAQLPGEPPAAPNVHGHGLYAVASTAIGGLGLVAEFKDYDRLEFNNAAGEPYSLPPAVLREHQFNLLNRYPHQLHPEDEIGFQLEATYVTDGISERGLTSFVGNWSLTRNHEPDRQRGNHFDDIYAEVQQELGEGVLAVGGLSFQRSFDSNVRADGVTPVSDPLLTLWTPVFDLRVPVGERYGAHLQFEHQHASSERLGSFDTRFLILEWSRSPNLSASLLLETSNKSDVQLDIQAETDTFFIAGEIRYQLMGAHEVVVFAGRRNGGFVCIGGVCRPEPAFDGIELKLLTRF